MKVRVIDPLDIDFSAVLGDGGRGVEFTEDEKTLIVMAIRTCAELVIGGAGNSPLTAVQLDVQDIEWMRTRADLAFSVTKKLFPGGPPANA